MYLFLNYFILTNINLNKKSTKFKKVNYLNDLFQNDAFKFNTELTTTTTTKLTKNNNMKVLIEPPVLNKKPYKLINDSIIFNSQIMQDKIVLQLFNTVKLNHMKYNGFFVEAGAYDGQSLSNSLHLERFKNWTGLLIEPSKNNYDLLKAVNRKSFTINCCLTELLESHLSYYIEAGPFSITTNNEHKDRIVCHSLDTIFKKLFKLIKREHVINYMSLDIEGGEKKIIERFPWNNYNISLLSIEYNQDVGLYKWIKNFFSKNGFIETIVDDVWSQDVYLAHKSIYSFLNLTYTNVSDLLKLESRNNFL